MLDLLDAMRAFGPEAAAWPAESEPHVVALGARPLPITLEDREYRPPLQSADGTLVLVADARIDNRPELAARLGLGSSEAGRLSDAAFILAAYEAWGEGCTTHLVGDFAFAVWDRRARKLVCARDPMGMRVLFYHQSPRRLAFATLPQALLALPDVPARLNEQRVAEWLVLFQNPETTFFSGIARIPPGCTLTASATGVRVTRYWSLRRGPALRFGSDAEYVEAFLEVFDRAVHDRLRAAGRIGILLSGGLDSSSVAASAAASLASAGRPLLAYHAAPRSGFQGYVGRMWVADESPEVEAIAARYPNLEPRIRRTDGTTQLDYDEAVFAHAGLPPRNPSNLAWYAGIHGAARAEGVTVLLAGDHGNNTISYDGYRSLLDLARAGRWVHLLQETTALARRTGDGRRDVLIHHVLRPLLPDWAGPGGRGARRRETAAEVATLSAIHPAFAASSRVMDWLFEYGEQGRVTRRAGSVAHRIQALESPADAPDLNSGYRAWMGIELRQPAIDVRVVEFCLAIPSWLFLREGHTRWLARKAGEGRLPPSLLEREQYGAQAADWPEWLPALKGRLAQELNRMRESDTARRCLDLDRMTSLLSAMPARLLPEHKALYLNMLLRGVMMGRFICWFEDRYR